MTIQINTTDSNVTDVTVAPVVENVSWNFIGIDSDLLELEKRIRKSLKSFVVTGDCLRNISDNDLYKSRGFKSFEKYVTTFFDMTKVTAYRLINASRIFHVLEQEYHGKQMPQNESQLRPLCAKSDILSDLDICCIWSSVVEGGKVTAATIAKAVKIYTDDTPATVDTPVVPDDTPVVTDDTPAFDTDDTTGTNVVQVTEDITMEDVTEESEVTDDTAEADDTSDEDAVDTPDTDQVVGDKINAREPAVTNDTTRTKGELVAALKLAEIRNQQLELELLNLKANGGASVTRSKMAQMIFKAGYTAMMNSVTVDQHAQLTDTYNTLMGN